MSRVAGGSVTDPTAATAAESTSATLSTSEDVGRPRQRLPRPDGLLVGAVIIATVLRLWRLGAQSLWYDEWLTTEAVSGSLSDLARHVANREGIPPPYFVVMWGWVRLFGDGEVALRLVSALAGIATVPVTYAAARELGQRRAVARRAALIVAVSPLLVWYSQEARPYSLLALFGALSVLSLARALNRGSRRDYLVWGAVGAAGVAIHYFAVFLIVAGAVALLIPRRPQRNLVIAGSLPPLAVLVVLMPVALKQRSHDANREWIANFALTERLQDAGRSVLDGPNPVAGRWWVMLALVVALSVVLLLTQASRQERATSAVLYGVGGGSILIAALAAMVSMDVFLSRYLIAAYPALVIAVAIGLTPARARWLGPRGVAMAAAGLLVGLSAITVLIGANQRDLQRPDWSAVAEAAETGSERRMLVLNVHSTMARPLGHYYEESAPLGDDQSVEVDQIDVLVARPTSRPCNFLVGRACALVFLGGPLPEPTAREFVLEERIELGQFSIDRYRAARLVPVSPADVVRPQDLPDALVLVPEELNPRRIVRMMQ
jgi:mannosyltransferase